jgi:hypothetical protein
VLHALSISFSFISSLYVWRGVQGMSRNNSYLPGWNILSHALRFTSIRDSPSYITDTFTTTAFYTGQWYIWFNGSKIGNINEETVDTAQR